MIKQPPKQAKQREKPRSVHVTLVFLVGGQRVGDAQFDATVQDGTLDQVTGAITMPMDGEQLLAHVAQAVIAAQRKQQVGRIVVPGRDVPLPAELQRQQRQQAAKILKLRD
jgi:hypothetical protein